MSFQPVIPATGIAGWRFLERTLETQQESFARSPALQRDTEYFRERIGGVDRASDLVADRRLLKVALGAFGLDEDINYGAFLRRVLEDGTIDPNALANRLSDKRYRQFAREFGFGDNAIPLSKAPGFGDRIAEAYVNRQFEVAVGAQDETMRLALSLRRELPDLAQSDLSPRAKWFTALGSPPLRKVFETSYALPQSFGSINLDQQLDVLRERTRRVFHDPEISQFADTERLDALARRFTLRAQMNAAPAIGHDSGSVALQLLQPSGSRQGAGIFALMSG